MDKHEIDTDLSLCGSYSHTRHRSWCIRRLRPWPRAGSRGRRWGIWWAWRDLGEKRDQSQCSCIYKNDWWTVALGVVLFFHIYWKESVAQVYMHKSLNWSEDMLFKGEVSYYTNIVVTHSEILLAYLVMTKSHKNIFCCCVTFQRVEEFSCGDVKDVDDSINGTTGQIFTIRALKVKIRYDEAQSHFLKYDNFVFEKRISDNRQFMVPYVCYTQDEFSSSIQGVFFFATFHTKDVDLAKMASCGDVFRVWWEGNWPGIN